MEPKKVKHIEPERTVDARKWENVDQMIQTSVTRCIHSGDLKYSVVIIVNNIVSVLEICQDSESSVFSPHKKK